MPAAAAWRATPGAAVTPSTSKQPAAPPAASVRWRGRFHQVPNGGEVADAWITRDLEGAHPGGRPQQHAAAAARYGQPGGAPPEHTLPAGTKRRGGWSEFSEPNASGPSAFTQPWTIANDTDGRIEVFGWDDPSQKLWLIYQTAPNSGWANWLDFTGPRFAALGYPAVARNADGRLEAFVEGSDGALYHRWQTSAGAGWANNPDGSRAWPSLGGSVTSPPAAISNGDGRLEVFARDSSGNIAHRWQASASGGWNPDGWQHIGSGNFAGWVSVGRNAGDGHLEVFAGGVDGKIYHSYQANGQPGGWTPWAQL